jgi:hypothetical protein
MSFRVVTCDVDVDVRIQQLECDTFQHDIELTHGVAPGAVHLQSTNHTTKLTSA